MTSVSDRSPDGGRRHDIDALRVLAFAVLILYHVGMFYVPDWGWHVKSGHSFEWLKWPMMLVNQWRMSLLFLISGVASIMYLIRVWQPQGQETGWSSGLSRPLPHADTLDRLAYRTAVIAFPIYSVGILLGAVWAEGAWGRFWGWDPKETASFVSWVLYAGYLHARATSGWGPKKAAWINLAGFAVLIFNLFFINIVVSGLHSYAGLN